MVKKFKIIFTDQLYCFKNYRILDLLFLNLIINFKNNFVYLIILSKEFLFIFFDLHYNNLHFRLLSNLIKFRTLLYFINSEFLFIILFNLINIIFFFILKLLKLTIEHFIFLINFIF